VLDRMPTSRAASARASHLRQVGRHADAAQRDARALDLAAAPGDLADARAGLVADALGGGDAEKAFALLPAARAAADADGGWRARTRLFWVLAELALLVGEPRTAAADADEAVLAARGAGARRHLTKSLLVRGVARGAAGDPSAAAMDLLTALEQAQAAELTSLVWPAAAVAADLVPGRGAELRAVAGAAAAQVVAGLGPDGPAFAARPDVAALLKHAPRLG
jgi:hypothetical protein